MVALDPMTLKAAVELCRSTPNVSIGVVMDTRSSAVAACRHTSMEAGVSRSTRTSVTFSTGSRIRYIPIMENIRGHRFDYVLIHSLIDNEENRLRLSFLERPAFQHIDIRDSRTMRGHRANTLVYDEFANIDFLDKFNSCQPGYVMSGEEIRNCFNQWWNETGQYEFSIDGDKITLKQKPAPDFGEISPSQELNDYVNALVLG